MVPEPDGSDRRQISWRAVGAGAPAPRQRGTGAPMIVAIESASSDPSLALAAPDGVAFAADGWSGEGRQASELLPRLLVLLARSGRELGEATALAIGVGPGLIHRPARLDEPGQGDRARPARAGRRRAEPRSLARGRAACRRGDRPRRCPGRLSADAGRRRSRASWPPRDLPGLVEGSLAGGAVRAGRGLRAVRHAPAARGRGSAVARLAALRLAAEPRGDDLAGLEPWYLRPPRGVASTETVSRWP